MLNFAHKSLKFTPFSLPTSFPQTIDRKFAFIRSIHSYNSNGGCDAFHQTPGGHVSVLSGDDAFHQTPGGHVSVLSDCKPNNPENSDMERSLNETGVQLTTPLVMEVLGSLRFQEKLAFRFFTWAGNHENYSHEPDAYNEMIDILSNTKYKARQYRVVCDLLDYMKRNGKVSVPTEALLKILRQYADKHLSHLHKFAKKKKVKLKKMQPEIDALNVLLDAFCKSCLVEDAEAMFMKLKNKVKPNASTYNILFFGWCRVRNPTRKAVELLEFMRAKGTFMSAPTAKTYSIMIVAFARNNRMDECFKLVDEMASSGCLPDVSTYREMIEGMCLAGKIEAAYKFLEDMGRKGYPPDIVTYNCFLKVLCDHKDSQEAVKLYKKMIEAGCVPSVQTYNMLLMMFFKMGDPNGAFEIWHEMDSRRCVRDTDSYCVMVEGLFGCERTEDACALLEEILNKGMKLPYQKFDSFLMQLSSIGDLRAIHRLSEHMRKFYNPVMARRFALNQKRKSVSLRGK
ncbi:hypothetical protein OSB04_009756 [Centaurea solstitialis]|uniref:Pentatricopeptide repeat-containing protein n=1 Tax=Centaurea solstitialis TaxID=347529 RepID=A0AA38WB84_9ASTR|nr:hypothetical protein OSB04_009756 [Centaurea solstitialis]